MAIRLGGDSVGMIISSFCAVHCAVVAILPPATAVIGALTGASSGFAPVLSNLAGAAGFAAQLESTTLEWALLGAAVVVAAPTLLRGWGRHGSNLPVGLFLLAIPLLVLSRLGLSGHHGIGHGNMGHGHMGHGHMGHGHDVELWLSVAGGMLLILAHWSNLRANRTASHQHHPHAHDSELKAPQPAE